ncbi:MAG: zinc-binding dehydrogenase, partial [Myxococcota bacterium]
FVEIDLDVAAVGGRIVLLGLLGGRTASVDLARVLVQRLSVIGTTLRSRSNEDKARIVDGVAREIWPLVTAGKVRPVIDRRVPITEADAAHEALRTNQTVGKVVLSVAAARAPTR